MLSFGLIIRLKNGSYNTQGEVQILYCIVLLYWLKYKTALIIRQTPFPTALSGKRPFEDKKHIIRAVLLGKTQTILIQR